MPFNPRCSLNTTVNNLEDRQARLDGLADNVPADHTIRILVGTTPGGPYGSVWTSAGTPGNNTLNQPDMHSQPAYPFLPSTTYYFVTQVWDSGNNPVAQSSECTFTTLATSEYLYKICSGFNSAPPAPFSPGFARNRLLLHVLTDTLPVFYINDRLKFETATSPTGPWVLSDLRSGAHAVMPNPLQPLSNNFAQFVGVPTHNTNYWIRVTVQNVGGNQAQYPDPTNIEQVVCGPFKTADYPTLKCLKSVDQQRGFTGARVTISPNPLVDWNSDPAWGPDQFTLAWGTTPGGPYPNAGTLSGLLSFNIAPGTAPPCSKIYYKVTAKEQVDTHGVYAVSPECVTSTLCAACMSATDVTETSATVNAQIVAPAGEPGIGHGGEKVRIALGVTAGGPYPTIGPVVAGNGANPQVVSFPVSGLTPGTTYHYVLQVSSNLGVFPFDQSQECTFTTPDVTTDPPTGVTNQCAVLNGNAVGTPVGCHYEIDYGKKTGGPYDHTAMLPPSAGGTEPFSTKVCGLDPTTQYYYRVRTVCGVKTIATGLEQTFTTLDGIWYCGTLFTPGHCIGVDLNGDGTIDYFYCV